MNNTLLSSYSGIKTHQFGLDSISNNIANVNTTGYRESRPEFETLFAPSKTNGNTPTDNAVNLGVTTSSNAISTKSGSYRASGEEFDLAYQGKGWFVVGDKQDGEMEIQNDGFTQKQTNYFTRDGNFGKDAQGYLVNSKGYYLYGVNLGKIKDGIFLSSPQEDSKNLASSKLSPIQIPQDLRFKPTQTTEVYLAVNLNKDQNPSNAYDAFLQNGKLDEEKFLQTDMGIFTTQASTIDLKSNKEAKITLKTPDGQETTYTFTYGNNGENSFRTIQELQTLIKDKTGLSLNIKTETGNKSPELKLELSSSTQDSIQLSGGIFDALGMNGEREGYQPTILPYNLNQTYAPNELVSYLGITFRRLKNEGNSNPLEDKTNWEIADTQNLKEFQENQSYQEGNVVLKGNGVYLMDKQNQFLKIGEAKTLEIPTYNPQNQYQTNTFVKFDGKIYQRIASLGNSNPKEDAKSWKEVSLNLTSSALQVPSYKSSVDIYNEDGTKYHLISKYLLTQGLDPQTKNTQTWAVSTYIEDLNGNKIGNDTLHQIAFDAEKNPIAQKTEIDFNGKKILYDLAGTEEKKSSNEIYSESRIATFSQNGNPQGILERTQIDSDGIITLSFSNGKSEAMGRVGIVAFNNDQGLSKAGGNLFGLEQTILNDEKQLKSGNPILGWNSEGNLTMGHIKQGYLETSNVDIGNALTELILMQRGYSMNAKSFTTGDEMIKEAINLKK